MEMIVSNIQQNRFHSGNVYSNYPAGKVTCRNAFELKTDTFVKNTPAQQVNFTGVSFFEAFIRNYLKQKAYKTSIRGSQRPYVSKDKDLAPLIRDVKIAVSPKEKINAWDINPKNSKDYVLFLHGFSQNITNNQPLYKELAKTKFGVLAIDYRGYGKNPPSANIQEEDIARDVAASIKYLKDSGAKNIGLIGHSFGAYIGAKVSDKIGVVKNLMEKADYVLIGGAMAFTFLKAKGYDVGKSIVDDESLGVAREILEKAEAEGKKIVLPIDVAATETYSPNASARCYDVDKIPSNLMGLDIGPKTIKLYKSIIKSGKTFIWNGPMGVFEFSNFSKGTEAIAKAIAKTGGFSIVGGGDSVAAVKLLRLEKKFTHLSTGGGATLALLEGAELPGLEALTDVKEN